MSEVSAVAPIPGGEVIRVLVVDEHPVIRGTLRMAFEAAPRLAVVGEAASPDEALAEWKRDLPDVVVTDVDLPGDGMTLLRRLRHEGYRGKIVVLTTRRDGATVLECLRIGIDAYLEKTQGLRTIGSSVLRVALGERLVAPEFEQAAVVELGRFARQAREGSEIGSSLTPREVEILRFISEGLTMRQIATRLRISPRTVETHVAKLYRKLSVRTRVQAVARAASLGLIDL